MKESAGLDVRLDTWLGGFHLTASFEAQAGLTVLFGPSGAGKSLTLQAIAGLLTPSAGYVRLSGRTLIDTKAGILLPARERRIGYVPQRYALFPHLSAAENIAFGLVGAQAPRDLRSPAARGRRVAELLHLVRLADFGYRRPHELSGGQAQRVALARALAPRPEALLLDEPLGALDAPTRAAVQDDLRWMVNESGVPAVVVTHDLAEARTLGDRMVVLVGGSALVSGTVGEVLANPPTTEAARLLGWRNVIEVRHVVRDASGVTVEIAGGQKLAVDGASAEGAGLDSAMLALHGDRIDLVRLDDELREQALRGRIFSVSDMGSYQLVSVELEASERAGAGAPRVAVTCSAREWAGLGRGRGDVVGVRVPPGAARLVADVSRSAALGRGET